MPERCCPDCKAMFRGDTRDPETGEHKCRMCGGLDPCQIENIALRATVAELEPLVEAVRSRYEVFCKIGPDATGSDGEWISAGWLEDLVDLIPGAADAEGVMSEGTDVRSRFDISPEQYHAGVDRLWAALGLQAPQDDDVFTLAAHKIDQLQAERKSPHLANWASQTLLERQREEKEFKRLRAIVDKLPKCWRLTVDGKLAQAVPVVPGMTVWITLDDVGLHQVVVSEVGMQGQIQIEDDTDSDGDGWWRVWEASEAYSTREAAEKAAEEAIKKAQEAADLGEE